MLVPESECEWLLALETVIVWEWEPASLNVNDDDGLEFHFPVVPFMTIQTWLGGL